jgi:hypothetical protein
LALKFQEKGLRLPWLWRMLTGFSLLATGSTANTPFGNTLLNRTLTESLIKVNIKTFNIGVI